MGSLGEKLRTWDQATLSVCGSHPMGLPALLKNLGIKARTHQESCVLFCDVPLTRGIVSLQFVQWMVARKQIDDTREM